MTAFRGQVHPFRTVTTEHLLDAHCGNTAYSVPGRAHASDLGRPGRNGVQIASGEAECYQRHYGPDHHPFHECLPANNRSERSAARITMHYKCADGNLWLKK